MGQRVRELRKANDLSLKELGEKLGKLTPAFISDIELGHRFPSEAVLEKIARALKTTVADLKQYDQRPPTKEMKELITSDPAYGFAFRKVVESIQKKNIGPEDLIRRMEGAAKKK